MTDDMFGLYQAPTKYRVEGDELRWSNRELRPVMETDDVLDQLVMLVRKPHSPHTPNSVVRDFATAYGPYSRCGSNHVHADLRRDMPPVQPRQPTSSEALEMMEMGPDVLAPVADHEPLTMLRQAAVIVNAMRSLLIDLKTGVDPRPEDWDTVFVPTIRWEDPKFSEPPQASLRSHPIQVRQLDRLAEVGHVITGWLDHFHVKLALGPYAKRTFDGFGLERRVPIAGLGAALAHGLYLEASMDYKVGRCVGPTCGVTWRVRRGDPNQRCDRCLTAARQRRRRGGVDDA